MKGFFKLLLLYTTAIQNSIQGPDQRRLLHDLFEVRKYNPHERPATEDNSSVTISIAFNLQQIVNLDEREQFLDSSVWIEHYWTDGGLRWNPADYGGISRLRLAPTVVWRPDILMYNSGEEEFDGTWPVNVVVQCSGAISYAPPAILRSICKMNVRWFPFDKQYCLLKFGSWTYDDQQVNVTLSEPSVITSEYTENGEFELVKALAVRSDKPYIDENYPYVALCLNLRRQALYYYFNLIMPAALISSMALLVFMLPADSGEKMGLSVTILLSLTVFSMVVGDFIPRTSEAIPILGVYFSSVMLMCSVAVVTSVWILNLRYFPHLNKTPPRWIRYGIRCLAKLLVMKQPSELASSGEIRLAAAATRAAKKEQEREREREREQACQCKPLNLQPTPRVYRDVALDVPPPPYCENFDVVKGIEKEMKVLSDKIRTCKIGSDIQDEWCFASRVVDRACLFVFLCLVLCTILLLIIIPQNHNEDDPPDGWPC